MSEADQAWETQRDDIFNTVADIDRPSDRIQYAFLAGYQNGLAELEAENASLRSRVKAWEEFDFERDNPKRLVDHLLALMGDRNKWKRRAETAEAVVDALRQSRPLATGDGEG